MSAESAPALRRRVITALAAISGDPPEHWERVIGNVLKTAYGWTIPSLNGNPTDNMLARATTDLVSRRWDCAMTITPGEYVIAGFPECQSRD